MGGSARRRRWLLQTVIGLLALPLSALPFWLYTTRTDSGYLTYLKLRYMVAPPSTGALDPAAAQLARAAARRPGAGVPVLVYHGIGRSGADAGARRYVVSRDHFAEHMRTLRTAGYRPITSEALAGYLSRPGARRLPRKPVLITFDDGRYDAMLQGDRILRDTGMRATMFVIGRASERNSPYYERWSRLAELARSGRWELENHTYDLHHLRGEGVSALCFLAGSRRAGGLRAYRRRVVRDLAHADQLLARHGARYRRAFAYPYSDWGSRSPPQAQRALRGLLARRFDVAFDQDQQDSWRPALAGDDRLHIHRLSVEDWSGVALLRRLERGRRRAVAVRRRRAA